MASVARRGSIERSRLHLASTSRRDGHATAVAAPLLTRENRSPGHLCRQQEGRGGLHHRVRVHSSEPMACCGSRAANVGTLTVGRRPARARVRGACRSLCLGQADVPLSPGHSRHFRDVVASAQPTAMGFGVRRKGFDQPHQRFAYISPGSIPQSAPADVVRLRAKRRQAACHQVRAVSELPDADRCRRGEATAARPTGPTEESDCRVDHVQDESIDPRGFVHGRTVNRRAQLRELTV